jgi:hypothetical protein
VSSEKHATAAEAGVEEAVWPLRWRDRHGGGRLSCATRIPSALIHLANSANVWRLMTCWRLSSDDTLLEGLAQDLEHMAAKLRPFIQEEDAVVGQ